MNTLKYNTKASELRLSKTRAHPASDLMQQAAFSLENLEAEALDVLCVHLSGSRVCPSLSERRGL
jgi:hypothetical protein